MKLRSSTHKLKTNGKFYADRGTLATEAEVIEEGACMIEVNEATLNQLADIIAERVAARLSERAERRFLSREEFAQAHGLGMRTIDRAIAEGRLQIERSGRRVLIPSNAKIQAAR